VERDCLRLGSQTQGGPLSPVTHGKWGLVWAQPVRARMGIRLEEHPQPLRQLVNDPDDVDLCEESPPAGRSRWLELCRCCYRSKISP